MVSPGSGQSRNGWNFHILLRARAVRAASRKGDQHRNRPNARREGISAGGTDSTPDGETRIRDLDRIYLSVSLGDFH